MQRTRTARTGARTALRKALAYLLTLALAFSLCGLPAAYGAEAGEGIGAEVSVATQETNEADFSWSQDGTWAYVNGYRGDSTDVVVPASLDGKPVREISLIELGLTSLDVSACTELTKLWCIYNDLTELNVSGCTALVYVSCGDNRIVDRDNLQSLVAIVSAGGGNVWPQTSAEGFVFSLLDRLNPIGASSPYGEGAYVLGYSGAGGPLALPASIGGSPVVSASLRAWVDASWQNTMWQVTSLDVTQCAQLAYLDCNGNSFAALDVSKNPKLEVLNCSGNPLGALDVGNNPELETIRCRDIGLATLDVSKNPQLDVLDCGTDFSSYDFPEFSGMRNLLATLDVSRNPQLTTLDCSGNLLTSLDVSANPQLATLRCSNNLLPSLDVSANPKLTYLNCTHNRISDATTLWDLMVRFGTDRVLPQDVSESVPFSVTFDSQGGGSVAGRSVVPGSPVGALPVPTRAGHAFDGWFTAPTGGTQVTAATVVTAHVTWYAHWTAVTHTVTFRGWDGKAIGAAQKVAHGSAAVAPSAPPRTGHTFTGWDTEFSSVVSDLTVTARYKLNTYTVKLDANGGRVSGKASASVRRDYGQALGTLAKPARSGHDFLGWYTGKAGGKQVSAAAKVTKDVTYYAHWKASSATVTLNANGGKLGKAATASVARAKGATLGRLATPTRTGHDFQGWYTAKSGGKKAAAGTKVTRNVTYWAHWKAKTYAVKLVANGGKVAGKASASTKRAYDSKLGKLAVPKRTGYSFLGWFTAKSGGKKVASATKVTKAVTLYAHWKRVR